jgi:hypothetical protein
MYQGCKENELDKIDLMFEIADFRASNMLWQAFCNKTAWDELDTEIQLRILRDSITKYYNNLQREHCIKPGLMYIHRVSCHFSTPMEVKK